MNIDDRGRQAADGLNAAMGSVPIPPTTGLTGSAKKATRGWMRTLEWSAGLAVVVLVLGFASQGGIFDMVAGQFANSEGSGLNEINADGIGTDGYELTIVSPADNSIADSSAAVVVVEASEGVSVTIEGEDAVFHEGRCSVDVELRDGWNFIEAEGFVSGESVATDGVRVLLLNGVATTTTEVPPTTTEPEVTTTTEPEATTTTTKPATTTTKPKATTTTKPATEHAIKITGPGNGYETDAEEISVTGTSQGEGHFKLYVEGQWFEFEPDSSGNWQRNVVLKPGWNTIHAKVYVGDDKVAYDAIEVYRSSGEIIDYSIAITSPSSGYETDDAHVTLTGTSNHGDGSLLLYVDGAQFPFEAAEDGSWTAVAELNPGVNTVWAKVYVNGEKVAYDTIEVVLNVPMAPFNATQVHGSSTTPADVFWGDATPNGEVKVFSEYGYTIVAVDGDGNYEAHVAFEGAPVGVEFSLYVKDLETGRKIYFAFTLLEGEPEV